MSTINALQNVHGTIALAGAGKMGGAMLTGWLAGGLDAGRVVVIEPQPSPEISALAAQGIRINPAAKDIGEVDTLVVAVKPQSFREAGATFKPFTGPSTLVVSIMAGTTIASLEAVCGGSVVRAMPNTPAAIGRGITVAVAAKSVSASCSPKNSRAPASRPACRQRLPRSSHAKPSRARVNCCTARNLRPRPCAKTSPRPAALRPPRWKC
jgi:pyrroline-5-carboxylate reductase